MATENPMRIMDGSRAPKWDPSRGTAAFASPVTSAVTDELGLLLRGHNIHRDQSEIAPNRSGSAPPSMEGSFAAFGNLLNQQRVSSGLENVQPEDMLQAGPLYSSYYNWRPPSDGRAGAPVYMPRSSLSTHEEDPEDDKSNEGAADERAEIGNIMLGQNALSFGGRHKSLVDLIQEDFPRTPSPVFASKNRSSSHVEEPFHHDMQSLSLDSLSLEASKLPEPNPTAATKDPSALPIPTNSSLDSRGRSISPHKDQIASKDARFTSDFVSDGTISSDASDNLHKLEDNQDKQQLGFDQQNQPHLQNTYAHHNAGYHVPVPQEQATGQRANNNRVMPQGVPPPLYATSAAYMAPGNSYYGNLSSAGLYSPQYSGYTMGSSYVPPYMAGYPPHSGFPLHFNANSGQSFSGQSAGIPTGESVSKGSVMQNLNRFYGQHGLTMHPPFPDPLSLQYFQHDPYGVPLQYSHLPSPGDQKFQFSPTGSVSVPSPRSMGVPSSGYLSSPTGLGFVPQFPASPLGSPVLPQSPVGGASPFGRRYDVGFSQSSPRSVSGFARWQGPRGTDSINDHRKHSFLEELKATSARRIDLSDIVGRIVEFSIDQHGSRFIQQKLENCSVEEKESVFKEVLPNASKLMTDVFGNYVIQKFFEHGTYEQRKGLASQLSGQMLPLSLQMYGCRVIQKALEVIEVEQKTELVRELDGHVMRCVRDQNGNHVIQKCIECIPVENIEFIISSFHGQVAALSTHPYGCRVIQRVLEHCSDDERCRSIVDEILESAYDLAHDQYGNYVTQHVLERGKPFERSQIISKLSGKVVQMSQHKYASNVVEKCLEFGDTSERELLIDEILDQPGENDNLLSMMKDQFANYVVQKILEISNDNQREILLGRIRQHIIALKKYTYGKHIVARFEQLCGEDDGTSEP